MAEQIYSESIDGHRVHGTLYRAIDARAVALLVHGVTADRSEWGFYELLGPRLQSAGITALAIDLRGHGESSLPPERLSISGALLDVAAGFAFLNEEAPEAPELILGNSFGGGVAYLAGMLREKVAHVFLTAPVLSYIRDIGPKAAAQWPGAGNPGQFSYVKFSLSEILIPEMWYFDSEIAQIVPSKPFTIVHGQQDSDVLFSLSEAFVKSRARGSLIGLEGMDHCWAQPGDVPPFKAQKTIANRDVAATVVCDLMRRSVECM